MLKNILKRSYSNVVNYRNKYLSPSLATFQAYDDPLILKKGYMQHVWDHNNNKYVVCSGVLYCLVFYLIFRYQKISI